METPHRQGRIYGKGGEAHEGMASGDHRFDHLFHGHCQLLSGDAQSTQSQTKEAALTLSLGFA